MAQIELRRLSRKMFPGRSRRRIPRKRGTIRTVRFARARDRVRGGGRDGAARPRPPAWPEPEGRCTISGGADAIRRCFVVCSTSQRVMLLAGKIEETVAQRPGRGLRSIVRSNLSQDGLHMSLYGRLRDLENRATCLFESP